MCGSEQGWVWGGLIVAGAMMVWAFASHDAGESAHRQQVRPPSHSSQSSVLTVSLDPLVVALSRGDLTIELAV